MIRPALASAASDHPASAPPRCEAVEVPGGSAGTRHHRPGVQSAVARSAVRWLTRAPRHTSSTQHEGDFAGVFVSDLSLIDDSDVHERSRTLIAQGAAGSCQTGDVPVDRRGVECGPCRSVKALRLRANGPECPFVASPEVAGHWSGGEPGKSDDSPRCALQPDDRPEPGGHNAQRYLGAHGSGPTGLRDDERAAGSSSGARTSRRKSVCSSPRAFRCLTR